MNDTQDDLTFLRPYTPDIVAWLSKFGEATAYYDANGHYARVQQAATNVFNIDDPAPGQATGDIDTATPQYPVSNAPPYVFNPITRCPGGGSAPAPDGSNPFLDNGDLLSPGDCNPAQIPPGP